MVNYITHQQSAIVRVLYLLSDHKRSDLWVPHLPLICNLFLSDVVAADYGNIELPVCEYYHVCTFNTMPRTFSFEDICSCYLKILLFETFVI